MTRDELRAARLNCTEMVRWMSGHGGAEHSSRQTFRQWRREWSRLLRLRRLGRKR